jgi:hypothetical protein
MSPTRCCIVLSRISASGGWQMVLLTLGRPAHLHGALKRRNGLEDGAPAEVDKAEAPVGCDEAEGMIALAADRRASSPWAVASANSPNSARHQTSRPRESTDVPTAPINHNSSRRSRSSVSAARLSILRVLTIVPRDLPAHVDGVVRPGSERGIIEADGDRQSPLAQLEPAVRVTTSLGAGEEKRFTVTTKRDH